MRNLGPLAPGCTEAKLSLRHTRPRSSSARPYLIPPHGAAGLTLIGLAWPASWLQVGPVAEYSFFPLWLGYILTVDAVVLRRKDTSLLTRSPIAFLGMFLASVPLWWAFEGINYFTENWHYIGAEEYSPLRYALVASWHFSIVIPAVLETAELLGSFTFMTRFKTGPMIVPSRRLLAGTIGLGFGSFIALVFWPQYAFPGAWLFLFLTLDPINYASGRPSVFGRICKGDWRLAVALAIGALVCGWFWEMWNYWAFPKWFYTIPHLDFARVFEMPLPGYLGYLPFGLEVFAVYHFIGGSLIAFQRVTRKLKVSGGDRDLIYGSGSVNAK